MTLLDVVATLAGIFLYLCIDEPRRLFRLGWRKVFGKRDEMKEVP